MKKTIAMVFCILCLTGCGKRGKLDFPAGATYPRQYPAARQPEQGRMKPVVEKAPERVEEKNILTETEE